MKLSKLFVILKRINEVASLNKYSRIASYLRFLSGRFKAIFPGGDIHGGPA